jgi:hypothetical protein
MLLRSLSFAAAGAALAFTPICLAQTREIEVDRISNWPAPLWWQPATSHSTAAEHHGRIREDAAVKAAAALTFGDTTTGLYSDTTGSVSIATEGTNRLTVRADGDLELQGSIWNSGVLFLRNLSRISEMQIIPMSRKKSQKVVSRDAVGCIIYCDQGKGRSWVATRVNWD